MSRQQKYAWFILVLFVITVAAYLILLPFIGPLPALGAVGFLGFAGFGSMFFRRKPGQQEPVMDERDELIQSKASHHAFLASYEWFILACMGGWVLSGCWAGREASVPAFILPLFVFGGMAVFLLAYALTVLILYGREARHGEDGTEQQENA